MTHRPRERRSRGTVGPKQPLGRDASSASFEAAKSLPRQRAVVLAFVYGTLAGPERAAAVLDDWGFEGAAVLSGLHRVDGEYPTLAPGGRVEGRLLRTDEVDRLDTYEGVDVGLYVRVGVPLRSAESLGNETVAVYVGDPDRLSAPAEWPGDGSFEERVAAYLDANEVGVRPRPGRSGSSE